jgi:hypothetical protein
MGQHRHREPNFRTKLLFFFVGVLLVSASIAEFVYRSPMGLYGNHVTGKLLALGIAFMLTPVWSYLRRKKPNDNLDR